MAVNKDEIKFDREAIKAVAAQLHASGFNCTQSVICALAPDLDIDADAAFRLAEAFGAGMGGKTETCGAISGAVMALGQYESTGAENPTSKRRSYKLSQELCRRFEELNGSNICRELKGVGVDHGPLRSCAGCIDDAIDIVIDIMTEDSVRA